MTTPTSDIVFKVGAADSTVNNQAKIIERGDDQTVVISGPLRDFLAGYLTACDTWSKAASKSSNELALADLFLLAAPLFVKSEDTLKMAPGIRMPLLASYKDQLEKIRVQGFKTAKSCGTPWGLAEAIAAWLLQHPGLICGSWWVR